MKYLFTFYSVLITLAVSAQHVGVGTANPTQALSVSGTIVVDHDTTNFGSPQQASLWFGAHGRTVINSNNNTFDTKYGSLNFWTNGQHRMAITQLGNVGIGVQDPLYKLHVNGSIYSSSTILANSNLTTNDKLYAGNGIYTGGGAYNTTYRLQVNNGNSYFGGSGTFTGWLSVAGTVSTGALTVNGALSTTGLIRAYSNSIQADANIAIGGAIDQNYRLRVWDGNARIGGDLHATGRAAIGGDIDENWKLRVYNGNSRFGGDIQVTGNISSADISALDISGDDLTINKINGKGVVRSNGNSSLRVGFDEVHVYANINAGSFYDQTVSLTPFDGSATNVRVFISQIMPGQTDDDWFLFRVQVFDVDSVTDTCKIRITNTTTWNRDFDSWIYLTSIAKD